MRLKIDLESKETEDYRASCKREEVDPEEIAELGHKIIFSDWQPQEIDPLYLHYQFSKYDVHVSVYLSKKLLDVLAGLGYVIRISEDDCKFVRGAI